MEKSHITQWIVASIVIVGAAILRLEKQPESAEPTRDERVEIVSWNWKKDRSGKVLAGLWIGPQSH